LVNDIIRFAFPQYLRRVTAPTGEFETTIAFALIATFLTLYVQANAVGGPHRLILEYVPLTGKGLMEGKGVLNKIGDIIISLFIGMLDIIGMLAKIISLSIRLFGNMSSGSILLNVIFIGIGLATV
jgi:F0F1-type ATP synthase membrane subunit a